MSTDDINKNIAKAYAAMYNKPEAQEIEEGVTIFTITHPSGKTDTYDKKEIEMMKKTSFLINTSRGAIVKEDDLVKALEDEKIAGAGLDVFEKEPLPQDHKLRFLPNALLLPHIGYVTAENYSKFYLQMVENLKTCLEDKPLRMINI